MNIIFNIYRLYYYLDLPHLLNHAPNIDYLDNFKIRVFKIFTSGKIVIGFIVMAIFNVHMVILYLNAYPVGKN